MEAQVVFIVREDTVQAALEALALSIPPAWTFITDAFRGYLATMKQRGEPLEPAFGAMDDIKLLVDYRWNRPDPMLDIQLSVMISPIARQEILAAELGN
jgi:hypothetical protein